LAVMMRLLKMKWLWVQNPTGTWRGRCFCFSLAQGCWSW
jgi:hypothetical protein